MAALIEVHDLGFQVKGKAILRNITFEVAEGGYLSILGPNGAGKTTLLKCLNRILSGTAGEIRVNGKSLTAYTQKALAQQIAYVPQANGTIPPFTVHEFALMARYPYLSPFRQAGARDEQAVKEALARTGMEAFAERSMNTLSGGERQKVLVAAALAQQTPILLLDEATTFLDPNHQADIYSILRRVNQEADVAILFVTHDINGAVMAGQQVLALREGQVVCCKSAQEIMDNESLSAIYGKRFLFTTHPETGARLVVPEGAS